MKMLDYDPIDRHISQVLKNWSHQVPLPLDGKERLYYQVGHHVPELPVHLQLLRTVLWLCNVCVVVPMSYLLTSIDYAVEDEVYIGLYRSRLDLSLAVRAMTNNTISHGVEIFTFVA
jgi:hypothetical protein